MPQMLCGAVEGRLLAMLTKLSRPRLAVEIGTFTGYSALCIASGLPADGRLITCEIDPKMAKFASSYFDRSPDGNKISLQLAPALETLASLKTPIDLAFVDADKENYLAYYRAIYTRLRPEGLCIFDNTLWSGTVLNPSPSHQDQVAIAELNDVLVNDTGVECVQLSIRDGVTIVRKLE